MRLKPLRAAVLTGALLMAAGWVYAQAPQPTRSPFTVLNNNTNVQNEKLYVEIMYEKSECRDYKAVFFLTKASGDTSAIAVDSFLNNLGTFETDAHQMSLMRPTAGGYRLRFDLTKVDERPHVDSGYQICVKAYTMAYKCVGCAAGGSDAIFADADIDPSCPYAQAMRDAADAPLLLACYRRESREGNWEAWVQDQRDCQPYRVVAMPDGRWWFAQNLNYQKDLTMYSASSTGPVSAPTTADGGFWCPGGKSFDGTKVSYAPTATPANATSTSGGAVACATYGALYSWATANALNGRGAASAQGICPDGWRMPTDSEWGGLLNAVEGCGNPTASSTVAPCNHVRDDMATGYLGSPAPKAALKGTVSCPPHSGKADTLCATADVPSWSWRRADYSGRIATPLALGNDRYGFAALPAGYRLGNGTSFDQAGVRAAFWTAGQSGTSGLSRSLINIDKNPERGLYLKQHGMSVRCVGDVPINEFYIFPYGNANTLMLHTEPALLLTASSGYTNYAWTVTPNDGISSTQAGNTFTLNNASGNLTVGQKYTVTVTANDGNGNPHVASKTVEITALPPVELPSIGLAGIYVSPNEQADRGVAVTLSAYSSVQPAGATYTWTAKNNTNPAEEWTLGTSNTAAFSTTSPTVSGNSRFTITVTVTAPGYKPASTSVEYTVRYCAPVVQAALRDTTVCPGADLAINPGTPTGGDGNYTYRWQTRATYTVWENVTGANSAAYTTPTVGANTPTRYYRRIVSSCGVNYYGNEMKVSPLVALRQTALGTQSFCPSTANTNINMAAAIGSTGAPTYLWQYSDNGTSGWTNQTNNNANSNPVLNFTTHSANRYYRRIAYDACFRDTSGNTLVNVNLTLASGAIAAPAACATAAGNATFTSTTNASTNIGTLVYQWRSATDAAFTTNVQNAGTNSATLSVARSSNLYYRRYASACGTTVFAGSGANTGSLAIIRNSANSITQNTFTQQNTCPSHEVTISLGNASGGDGVFTYQWQYSTNNSAWTNMPAAGTKIINGTDTTTIVAVNDTELKFTTPSGVARYTPYLRRQVSSCGATLSPTGVRAYTSFALSASLPKVWTVCPDETVNLAPTITNAVAGTTTTYQWQIGRGAFYTTTTWDSIKTPEGRQATYPITLNLANPNSDYYRVIVGTCNGQIRVTTDRTEVTLVSLPIQQTLSDVSTCPGEDVTFSLGAATGGDGTYTYQWQQSTDNVNYTDIAGATTLNYSVKAPPTAATFSPYYRRKVTSCGNLTSYTTGVRIYAINTDLYPGFMEVAYNVAPNTTVNLWPDDAAGGITYQYQWQESTDNSMWTDIADATSHSYVAVAPGSIGVYSPYYRRQVTSCGITATTPSTRIYTTLDCPYKGNDLVDGSCRRRTKWEAYGGVAQTDESKAGAENWEAQIRDSRDGRIYRIVQIGDMWWLAQNLNYQEGLTNAGSSTLTNDISSKGYYQCYNAVPAACDAGGALYPWYTNMAEDGIGEISLSTSVPSGVRGVCPHGWHVPSAMEWGRLLDCAEGNCDAGVHLNCTAQCGNAAGIYLKSASTGVPTIYNPIWNYAEGYYATDKFGLSIMAVGRSQYGSGFDQMGGNALYWATGEASATNGNRRYFQNNSNSVWGSSYAKNNGFPTRCIYDGEQNFRPSSAPTTVVSEHMTVPVGTSLKLVAQGGVLGNSGNYQWSTTANFGAGSLLIGNRDTLEVTPSSTTTYYVRRVDNNSGNITYTSSAQITITTEACPYTASDLVLGSCRKRSAGATNWEAYIWSGETTGRTDDREQYRIVQMPDTAWWFAQDVLYAGIPYCKIDASSAWYQWSSASTACPTGWNVPSFNEWQAIRAEKPGGIYDISSSTDLCGNYNDRGYYSFNLIIRPHTNNCTTTLGGCTYIWTANGNVSTNNNTGSNCGAKYCWGSIDLNFPANETATASAYILRCRRALP